MIASIIAKYRSGSLKAIKHLLARGRLFLRQRKWSRIRSFLVATVGGTVLLVGVAMIVLPGPAIVVIPIGLVILATEFIWAKRLLRRTRAILSKHQ